MEKNIETTIDDNSWCYGDAELLGRCCQLYGWSADFGSRVLEGYRQFLACKTQLIKEKRLERLVVPSPAVHRMWTEHIIDTDNYIRTCEETFHVDYIHRREIAMKILAGPWQPPNPEALQVALCAIHGVDAIDQEVWNFDHTSDATSRTSSSSSSGATAKAPEPEEEKENNASLGQSVERSLGQICDNVRRDIPAGKKKMPIAWKPSVKVKRCNICGKSIDSRAFHLHYARCSGKGKKRCPLCSKRFRPRGFRFHYNHCLERAKFLAGDGFPDHMVSCTNGSAGVV